MKHIKLVETMNHIPNFSSFITEGTYSDLKSFLDDLVYLVKKNKKDFNLKNSTAIQLDTVGGFGFKKETVVIKPNLLATELGTPEKFVEDMVEDTFKKYKSVLRRGSTQTGSLFVTYKK